VSVKYVNHIVHPKTSELVNAVYQTQIPLMPKFTRDFMRLSGLV
jgi:hypothetical protein